MITTSHKRMSCTVAMLILVSLFVSGCGGGGSAAVNPTPTPTPTPIMGQAPVPGTVPTPRPTPAEIANSSFLPLINAGARYAGSSGGRGIVVAVIDDGVDFSHPDLGDDDGEGGISSIPTPPLLRNMERL